MKNPARTQIFLAALAALACHEASAQAPSNMFRAESPSDRPMSSPSGPPDVSFRDDTNVTTRSAVTRSYASSSEGKNYQAEDAKFVPTLEAGSGNFQKRPYRFTFSANGGYDDNVYTSSNNEQGSFFTSASLGATLTLSNGRTSVLASLNAGGSYFFDRDDSFDPEISFNLDMSHVFSPKLRLDVSSYLSYQAEPQFALGSGQNRRSGNYFFGNVGFSLSHTLTRRFSMIYGYSVSGLYYEEGAVADLSNRIDQIFSLQLRYLIQPTISIVGEYRFGVVTYDSANRDSTSNYALGGVDFTLNRRLTASLRAGAQFRDSDDGGQETSPFVESTLSYKYGERSTLQWTNRYGFEESDQGFGSTRQTYRTGLTLNQQISSRITGNVGAYYTTSSYEGAFGDDEESVDFNLGLIYSVNRLLSLQTGYTYTRVYSDNSFREYDRNRIYLGATLSF